MKTITFHIVQSVPFGNPNRGEDGQPKSMEFGGQKRSRISSQCLRRPIRQLLNEGDGTLQTKHLTEEIAKRIMSLNPLVSMDEAKDMAKSALAVADFRKQEGDKKGKPKGKPKAKKAEQADDSTEDAVETVENAEDSTAKKDGAAVIPISGAELNILAEFAILLQDEKSDKKAVKALLEKITQSIPDSVKLFGRMVATSNSSRSVQSAVQSSHAFTVHAATVEQDVFVAVDDSEEFRSNRTMHLDNAAYSTGIYYRTERVLLDGLKDNCVGDAEHAAELVHKFTKALFEAFPTGKENVAWCETKPSYVLVTVRDNGNDDHTLAGAFQNPIRIRGSYNPVGETVDRLVGYYTDCVDAYDAQPNAVFAFVSPDVDTIPASNNIEHYRKLSEFTDRVRTEIRNILGTGGKGAVRV